MTAEAPATKPPHPSLYFILFLPFGATAGFIMVTIGSLAKKAGMSDATIAGMVAMNTLPHTWKFLWAPLVDTLWTGRGWYIATNLISSAAIITLGFIPITDSNITLMTALIFINGLSTTFIGMCTEALMAKLTPPEQRGAAGGWSQAGNVGGSVVGGVGLILSNNLEADWWPFVIVGALLLSCSVVLSLVKEPPRETSKTLGQSMRELGRDLWALLVDDKRAATIKPKALIAIPVVFLYVLSGTGILALGLCLMPIGSGGALGMLPLMGAEWGASDNVVALANGLATGGAAIIGSLLGGVLATKLDKRRAYALSGVLLALFTFAMALAPKNSVTYVIGCMLYNVGLGLCYATFAAFVLDIIGHTGGATKYNIFASLANMPIFAMGLIDGWASEKFGRVNMLLIDGASGVAGAVVLLLLVWVLRRRKLDPALTPPSH